MKITLTITKKTPVHITFQVFVNGGLSGSLILRNEEFNQFCEIMQPDRIRDDEFRGENNCLMKGRMCQCPSNEECIHNENGKEYLTHY